MDTCHHYHDIYPEERMRDVSRPNYSATERPPTPEDMKLAAPPNRTNLSPIFPLAFKKILEVLMMIFSLLFDSPLIILILHSQLQIMMSTIYFSVSQLITLLEFFPPEEGYLRVQLIMTVFSHITDLENMYLIIDNVLTFDERNEVFFAI